MKKIVLFDMDGTLTPPRQSLDVNLIGPLKVLTHFADIGVVTGSDINYIKEQLDFLLINTRIRYKLHLLPCNGTKHYTPPSYNHEQHKLTFCSGLKDYIGEKKFHILMKLLIEYQSHISNHYEIPLTGHFISYRGSMVNWCPIGRNASIEEREEFVNLDVNFRDDLFRNIIIDQLRQEINNLNLGLVIKLGGETSFDIYPIGWDKTFALQHFEGYQKWFVGDKCHAGGNDQEIYQSLLPDNSFSVSNSSETVDVINNILIPLFKKEGKNEHR